MQQAELEARIAGLSPEKQQLLALRLGMAATQQQESDKKTTLAAFVTVNEAVDGANLREHLRKRLPQYMVPAAITVLDDLPRTPNGKVDREALLRYQPQIAAPQTVETQVQAHDEIEERLLQLWQEMLGMDVISVEDDFFEIGGYSLLAIRMFGQVKQMFQKDLPVSTIFEAPTIAKLANILRAETIDESAVITLNEGSNQPPIYCFQVNRFGVLHYQAFADQIDKAFPVYGLVVPSSKDLKTIAETAQFFADVIAARPYNGTIYLMGLSVAGVVAYETARLLHQRGQAVQVVMVDTQGPDYPTPQPVWQALQQKSAVVLQEYRQSHVRDWLTITRQHAWVLSFRLKFQLRKRANWMLAKLGLPLIQNEQAEELRIGGGAKVKRQLDQYYGSNPTSDVPILLYRARLQPITVRHEWALGWDKVVPAGRIRVYTVVGSHTDLLRVGFVEPLLADFQRYAKQP
jgi:thioesterase domain-containing protein